MSNNSNYSNKSKYSNNNYYINNSNKSNNSNNSNYSNNKRNNYSNKSIIRVIIIYCLFRHEVDVSYSHAYNRNNKTV